MSIDQVKFRKDYLIGVSCNTTGTTFDSMDFTMNNLTTNGNLTIGLNMESFPRELPELELPFVSQCILIALYACTTLLALTGNLLVIFVLFSENVSKTVLNRYLINLSVASLLMACFCIPFSFTNAMLGHWIFGTAMCPTALFMQVTSVAVSIFTDMAIGIDR